MISAALAIAAAVAGRLADILSRAALVHVDHAAHERCHDRQRVLVRIPSGSAYLGGLHRNRQPRFGKLEKRRSATTGVRQFAQHALIMQGLARRSLTE